MACTVASIRPGKAGPAPGQAPASSVRRAMRLKILQAVGGGDLGLPTRSGAAQ
jgi:hypothetical protein